MNHQSYVDNRHMYSLYTCPVDVSAPNHPYIMAMSHQLTMHAYVVAMFSNWYIH
jgi:hypothetical protein